MRIVLLCATRRGRLFLEKLVELAPEAELVVFSFREETWEPPFLDSIRDITVTNGGTFYETRSVGSERWRTFWEQTPIDLMLVVSWRYLIPAAVYTKPRLGTFVFHDSLLPVYRGFAPTQWAILNGEKQTGVTLFQIADEVDSGDIVAQCPIPIDDDDTIAEVMERVTQGYLDLIEQYLPSLLAGSAPRTPQNHADATFTCRRLPEDNAIEWTQSTKQIYNLIRATTMPYTGAFTTLNGQTLRVWKAKRLPDYQPYVGRVPGRVVEIRQGEGAVVLTGDGALLLTEVQLEGETISRADLVLNKLAFTLGR